MTTSAAEVAEQITDIQKLRRADMQILEALRECSRLAEPIGPGHLKFLEVGFLKPGSNNPRWRYA